MSASKYKSEYCQQLIDAQSAGKSQVWFAAEIHVCRDTLNNWATEIPEFKDALAKAKIGFERYWEANYQEDMRTNKANGAMWMNYMRNRCNWNNNGETVVKTEHSGKVDMTSAAINDKIAALISKVANT